MLNDQATVLHVEHARRVGDLSRLLRDDAQLEPQRGRPHGDSLSGHVRRQPRWPEDVDQAHVLGDVGQGSVDGFSENFGGVRIDGNDPSTLLLHVGRHRVCGLLGIRTGTHHGDGVVGDEDALDDGIGVVHTTTVPGQAGP